MSSEHKVTTSTCANACLRWKVRRGEGEKQPQPSFPASQAQGRTIGASPSGEHLPRRMGVQSSEGCSSPQGPDNECRGARTVARCQKCMEALTLVAPGALGSIFDAHSP